MIYLRLFSLSLCLQLTLACLPVQPAEDLPCPSVPLAQMADDFLLSGLSGPVDMNGAKVYSCPDPDYLMLSVDGTKPTPLAQGAKITCNPNSGIFVLDDGTAVGTKKFNCGQKLVPCPTFRDAPDVTGNDVTKAIMTTEANGDSVWKCEPPSRLYAVENDMANMAAKKDEGVYVTCKKQSGKLTFSDEPSTTVDPVTTSFACGTLPCQKCDMSIFTDEMNGFCSGQTAIFCDRKPVVSPGADECPSVTCPGGSALHLMTSATASVPVPNVADIKCDAGAWKNGATAVPMGSFLVCATAATCDAKCDGLIAMVYDAMAATVGEVQMTGMRAKPTCTYTCPQNFKMDFLGAPHQSVVCRMDTGVVTLDMEGGTTPSTTNKFSCLQCMCSTDKLKDGKDGLCPLGKLCAKPSTTNICLAKCPADSSAIYFDSMRMRKPSPTINCVLPNQDWIEANSDTVTCQYADGKGYTDMQPPGTCTPLPIYNCDSPADCDNLQRVYYKDGDNTVLTCNKGFSLIYNNQGFNEPTAICSVTNMWPVDITVANCIKDDAQASPVQRCLEKFAPAVRGVVSKTCAFGVCFFTCPGTQQFEYTVGTVMEKNANLKCEFEDVITVDSMLVDDAMAVTCV